MKVLFLKFRPSSHSEDFTIIAEYATPAQANKAEAILKKMLEDMKTHEDDYDSDWEPDEASVSAYGRNVSFEVYTAGYLSHVISTMNKLKPIKPLEVFRNYQEIAIKLTLPEGMTIETIPLVFDARDVKAVRWLTEKCGKPKRIKWNGKEQLMWLYKGDEIYYGGTLWAGAVEINVYEKEYWDVDE